MPNWVYNDITIAGKESIDKFFELMTLDNTRNPDDITFAKIAHKPVCGYFATDIVNNMGAGSDITFMDDEFEVLGNDSTRNLISAKYFNQLVENGDEQHIDWYAWNCENYGTKWDACDATFEQDDNEVLMVSFNTAWSCPEPIYHLLAENGVVFEGYFADEGIPENAGAIESDGQSCSIDYNRNNEAREIIFGIDEDEEE